MPVLALSAARGQDTGSECPDVPLPAPKAADALHGEVSSPGSRQQGPVTGPCPAINWGAVNHPPGLHPLSASSPRRHKEEPKLPDSASSDEENEDGDFTVYECPGLAPVWRAQGSRRGEPVCAGWDLRCELGCAVLREEPFQHVLHQTLSGPTPLLPPCALSRSHWSSPVSRSGWPGMGAPARGFSLGSAALRPQEQRARAALGRPNLPSLRCQGRGHLGLLGTGTGGLLLVPPQCLDRGPVTPQSQGGLSWLAGDPGEGQLLTALGTKSTKRPERSLSHGNGCGARPSGPRLRVIIRSLQAH